MKTINVYLLAKCLANFVISLYPNNFIRFKMSPVISISPYNYNLPISGKSGMIITGSR